uniref:Dermatan sulfate epimerase like n=1 Tax=Petromyzon marinus TaxID=7757 RepID=S4RN50_PETMA
HPLLYFGPGDARVLQQQAHTTHAHLAKVIRNSVKSMMSKATFYLPPVEHEAFAARWNEIYGNNLGALAIYCVLFPGDETALKFTLEYMDRMCSYPRWQVRDAPQDEVPVAHSLVGFATAFDFLYYGDGQRPLPEPDLHSVLPTVVVASLPASGAEILKELFAGTTDFAYIAAPTHLVRLPDTEFEVDPFVDACEWTYADVRSGRFPTLQGWFQSLLRNPRLHLQNMPLHGLLPKRRVLSHESGVSLG